MAGAASERMERRKQGEVAAPSTSAPQAGAATHVPHQGEGKGGRKTKDACAQTRARDARLRMARGKRRDKSKSRERESLLRWACGRSEERGRVCPRADVVAVHEVLRRQRLPRRAELEGAPRSQRRRGREGPARAALALVARRRPPRDVGLPREGPRQVRVGLGRERARRRRRTHGRLDAREVAPARGEKAAQRSAAQHQRRMGRARHSRRRRCHRARSRARADLSSPLVMWRNWAGTASALADQPPFWRLMWRAIAS